MAFRKKHFTFELLCLFHLLAMIYFDHTQFFLTVVNIFRTCSNFFDHGKVIFYFIDLHIRAWSKIFVHIQKILNLVKKFERNQFFFELAEGLGINLKRYFDFGPIAKKSAKSHPWLTKSKCQQQKNLVFSFSFWFQFIQRIEHKLTNTFPFFTDPMGEKYHFRWTSGFSAFVVVCFLGFILCSTRKKGNLRS